MSVTRMPTKEELTVKQNYSSHDQDEKKKGKTGLGSYNPFKGIPPVT
jgi:hypothetical protein